MRRLGEPYGQEQAAPLQPTTSMYRRDLHFLICWGLLAACFGLFARCDTVEPGAGTLLVVESFLDAEKVLPRVVLRQTRDLDAPYPDDAAAPVTDAEVVLTLDGRTVTYEAAAPPGQYLPAPEASGPVPAGAAFSLRVRWRAQQAYASGTVPPPISIDSVRVKVPAAPVQAVLLDSLRLDSLGVGAEQGYIYPVEVALWWTADLDEAGADSLYWIRTQLKPFTAFSSTVIDFFLRPGQILRERTIPRDELNRRRWTGVYAVPVPTGEAPLPQHELKVSLLRSGQDYARFASSRDAPERREPTSNVQGGIGIVAGISVDSVQVRVE